jgi:hypothetical protein
MIDEVEVTRCDGHHTALSFNFSPSGFCKQNLNWRMIIRDSADGTAHIENYRASFLKRRGLVGRQERPAQWPWSRIGVRISNLFGRASDLTLFCNHRRRKDCYKC